MKTLLNKRPLRPHQLPMLCYANHAQHPALFVDMRLGKTLVAIRRTARYHRVLVVAPYSALYGWEEQLRAEGLGSTVLTATEIKSKNAIVFKQYTLTNKESHLVDAIRKILLSTRWDAVILDESTFIKSPAKINESTKGKRPNTSAFYCQNFRNVKCRMILTGTPAPENELEYFQQLYFLDPTILGMRSWWEFRAHYFNKAIDDEHLWFISKRGRELLGRALAKNCFFMKRADVKLGGEKLYQVRKFELPAEARKIYDRAESEFILVLPGEAPELTKWAMQRFLWLRRLASGIINKKIIHEEKLAVLLELLNGELAKEQVIIWAQFIEEVQWLSKKLSINPVYGAVNKYERERLRQLFQHGEQRIFLAQPECFRHGTDLSAASTMIYFSTPLGRETREQTEDRFIDMTKTDSALVLDLVGESTIEEDIQKSMKKKYRLGEMMQAIINGARARCAHS